MFGLSGRFNWRVDWELFSGNFIWCVWVLYVFQANVIVVLQVVVLADGTKIHHTRHGDWF